MKIVEIREKTIPISSPIRNAYIDFSKMTLSLVAVITTSFAMASRWSAMASIPTVAMVRAS